jgi:uracil-DNA glycosylase
MKVLFVGSNPSSKNTDPGVPFIGTHSFSILQEWAKFLNLKDGEWDVMNASDRVLKGNERLHIKDFNLERLNKAVDRNTLPIALGKNAAKALEKCGILYLRLPHPSGRNRALNDKEKIETMLLAVKWNIILWGKYEVLD